MGDDKVQQFIELQRKKGQSDAVIKVFLKSKGVDPSAYFEDEKELKVQKDQRPLSQKVGNALGSVFGGKVIGDYIGSKIAERDPYAQKEKQSQIAEGRIQEGDNLFKTPSVKQWLGEAATIGTNFLPVTRVGKLLLGGRTIAGAGAKAFLGSAATKFAGQAAFGAVSGGARAAADDESILGGAAAGAATMGAFSLAGSAIKGLLLNKGTRAVSNKLYEWGLGISKKNLANEERLGHKKAEMLMEKIGFGTARQIKERTQAAFDEAETGLQDIFSRSNIKYRTADIRRHIIEGIQKQYKATLRPADIKAIVAKMPLGALRGKKVITQMELNELRREFSNNFLTDNAWLATELPQNKNAFRTAASVMSELVKKGSKKTEPQIRSLFAEESAYLTALKGIEQIESRTMGPVNTAAQFLGPAAGAGAGFAAGGPVGAAGGAALEILGGSTIGRTGAAVALRNAGIAIERLSQSEQANLIALLAKLGIVSAE